MPSRHSGKLIDVLEYSGQVTSNETLTLFGMGAHCDRGRFFCLLWAHKGS